MAFWNKKPADKAPAAQPAAAVPAATSAPARPAPVPTAAPPPPVAAAPPPAQQQAGAPPSGSPKGQPSLNSQLAMSLGKVVSVLMFSERYQGLTLRDLTSLILPPLAANQFVVAEARPQGKDVTAPIGLLLWASVSDEQDQRFAADASQPTRLAGAQWTSGHNLWIIETVGPQNVIEAMMKQLVEGPFKGKIFKFRTRAADGSFSVQVVDPTATQTA